MMTKRTATQLAMATRTLVGTALALDLLTGSLTGQKPPGADTILSPGTVVRITVDARVPVIGTLAYLRADTLAFQRTGTMSLIRTPLDSVTRLEIQAGTRRKVGKRTLHGALIGGGIGVGLGIFGAIADQGSPSGWFHSSAGDYIAAFGGFGLVTGAAVGLLVGIVKTERIWEPVSVGPLRVGLGIGQGGIPGTTVGIAWHLWI